MSLAAHLQPLMRAELPPQDTVMARTVSEAIRLPSAEMLEANAVTEKYLKAMKTDALAWLRIVLRAALLPADLEKKIFGMRKATNQEDALISAWKTGGRTIQTVVTRQRVHVLTEAGFALEARFPRTLELAHELFALEKEPPAADWKVRPFGAYVFAYRDFGFVRNWDQSMLIVSDGAGVKFSFLKWKNRDSPEKGGSAHERHESWFLPQE